MECLMLATSVFRPCIKLMMLYSYKNVLIWQWRFLLLEHCVAYVFSFPLLRFKHMATTISVMGIPRMKRGLGAKPKYLCCTVISKVTIGFLRYFQLKQLPNFLVASPILSLAVCSVLHYVRSQPEILFSLGFRASNGEKRPTAPPLSLDRVPESNSSHLKEKSSAKMQDKYTVRQRKQRIKGDNYVLLDEYDSLEKPRYLSTFIVPCTLHLLFMAATAFFVMHVQVSTRFLSACPPLYWFASHLLISPGTGKRWGYMIWTYSTAYILLGSLLFSNFYPFTWNLNGLFLFSKMQASPTCRLFPFYLATWLSGCKTTVEWKCL